MWSWEKGGMVHAIVATRCCFSSEGGATRARAHTAAQPQPQPQAGLKKKSTKRESEKERRRPSPPTLGHPHGRTDMSRRRKRSSKQSEPIALLYSSALSFCS